MRKIILGLFSLFIVTVLIARDIKTNDGHILKNVTITKITPSGLEIMHAGGGSFVKFENLSKGLQDEFHYDKIKAEKYEAELKLKKQKMTAVLAEKKKLKKTEQQALAKQKALLAKQQQEFKYKQRAMILQTGSPVILARRVLYSIDGKTLFASTKLVGSSNIFLAADGYMLVNNEIYLVKDNIISITEKLTLIKSEIDKISKTISEANKNIADWEDTIDNNIERIDRILGRRKSSRADYYDEHGRYIGSTKIEEELNKAQIDLIRRLNRDNRRLDRDIVRKKKRVDALKKKLSQFQDEYSTLANAKQQFDNIQRRSAENVTQQTKQKKSLDMNIESKLLKLKEMFERGLIPKDVYHEKVSELIDLFIGKVPAK